MRKFMFYNRFFIINSHPIGNGRNSKQVAPPELRVFLIVICYKQSAPTELIFHFEKNTL